ncbi:MAG: hypothetical protein IJW01_07675 [Paludibacteraceae bacterium]|nr:hypothetical protein [Paludibacteraceae bacterium]
MKRKNRENTRKGVACAGAGRVVDDVSAPHIVFNPTKKLWQTPDGLLFLTRKEAECHLKNS